MMDRLRERSPLVRTRSPDWVAASAKPCCCSPLVQPRSRGGLERFFRSSTRVFFCFAIGGIVRPSLRGRCARGCQVRRLPFDNVRMRMYYDEWAWQDEEFSGHGNECECDLDR